jgi:hypothetical protein
MSANPNPQPQQQQRCAMFQCQACGCQEFKLMMQPGTEADVSIAINEHQDVEITVNGKRFVADLAFMNQFAACTGCSATKQWDYFYS